MIAEPVNTKIMAAGYCALVGTVLGVIAASGFVGPYDPYADDGRNVAVCILGEDCDARYGATDCTVVNLFEYTLKVLVWPTSDPTHIASAIAGLLTSDVAPEARRAREFCGCRGMWRGC